MTKNSKSGYVTFLNSAGEEISNDPLWLAQKQLSDAGVEHYSAPEFDVPGDYDEFDGAALKALAKERKISLVGIRKASAIRELLEQWDEDNESADGDSSDEDDDSGNDSTGNASSETGNE